MRVIKEPFITVEEVNGNILRCTLHHAPERNKLRFTYHIEPNEIQGLSEALEKGWRGNVNGPGRYRLACKAIGYDVVERLNPQTQETVLGATNVAILDPSLVPMSDRADASRFEELRRML